MFPLLGWKPVPPSENRGDFGAIPYLIRGYRKLVLASKDPRSRAFSARIDRLASEVEAMASATELRVRARELLESEVETFAQEQRREIERTIAVFEGGIHLTASRLEEALRAGDSAAETMQIARDGLDALDKVTNPAALRAGLDAEIHRLNQAVKTHARETAEAREAMRCEVAHLRLRLSKAQDLANRDTLTGLANRSEFERRLRAVTFPERHVVAVIDLNGFKPINEAYGHGAGDRVLAEFARRLVTTVGRNGIAARIGGDEFALLAEDSEAHLTTRLRALEISLRDEPLMLDEVASPLGMSFGTAPFERDDPSRAIGIAGGRMYLYKRAKEAQRAA